jgi:hypothetical protein
MSRRVGNVTIIEAEPDGICGWCGKIAETRPYGPGFSEICYACAAKDEPGTEKRMNHKLFGDPILPEDIGTLPAK